MCRMKEVSQLLALTPAMDPQLYKYIDDCVRLPLSCVYDGPCAWSVFS